MFFEVRMAAAIDFEAVGKVFEEENRFHAELIPEVIQVADPVMTREWFDEILINPTKDLIVAEAESNIVGVALVELRTNISDPIFRQRKYAYVDEIAVLGSYRGQGIGRLLMKKIEQWAEERDIIEFELQVWERNRPAIGFYENLGYQPWRRTMRLNIDDQKNVGIEDK